MQRTQTKDPVSMVVDQTQELVGHHVVLRELCALLAAARLATTANGSAPEPP